MNGNRPIGGTFEDIGENLNQSVVRPVTDEVGKAIEAGMQSVVGGQRMDPQQKLKKEEEDKKKLSEWRWRLQKLKELDEVQKKIREDEMRKKLSKQKAEQQSQQKNKQAKQFEVFKKQKEVNPEIGSKGKAELKRGVGG